jgi:hypothetical protein
MSCASGWPCVLGMFRILLASPIRHLLESRRHRILLHSLLNMAFARSFVFRRFKFKLLANRVHDCRFYLADNFFNRRLIGMFERTKDPVSRPFFDALGHDPVFIYFHSFSVSPLRVS